jgi:hypothetical protein
MSNLDVLVSSSAAGYDSDGNPIPTGAQISMRAIAIAPGNTSLAFITGGDTDVAEFTVYLPLGSPVVDDDQIEVRGKHCRARVREWVSPYTGRGGLEVLCRSVTGTGGAAIGAGGGPVRQFGGPV